jgi:hypothetical protein
VAEHSLYSNIVTYCGYTQKYIHDLKSSGTAGISGFFIFTWVLSRFLPSGASFLNSSKYFLSRNEMPENIGNIFNFYFKGVVKGCRLQPSYQVEKLPSETL